MVRIALIDDDPTEAMVLEGMLLHCDSRHTLTHFKTLEAFPSAPQNSAFDLILLDRRIPPHAGFDTSLPILAAMGFEGPVIPISASGMDTPNAHGLKLETPVMKSDLLTPDAVAALLDRVLNRDQ